MRKEKTLCANRGQVKKDSPIKTGESLGDKRGKVNSFKLYDQGIQLYNKPLTAKPMTGGGIRGEISGWSSASRRRMREYMITHAPPADMRVCGVTLTIPGPTMEPERAKNVFSSFCHNIEKKGDCAVWRLEIQERGQLHWHLICGTQHPADVVTEWHDCIRAMGRETFDPPHEGKHSIYKTVENRMCIIGASEHAADLSQGGDKSSWFRYMQDHTTKAKQEQIAVGIGRHWGVIGRKRFVSLSPKEEQALTDKEIARYLRMHQRLATGSEKHDNPFGRRLRGRLNRGCRGTSTWFGNPATMARMVRACVGTYHPVTSYIDYISQSQAIPSMYPDMR